MLALRKDNMMLNEDHFIFSCKMGVTFDEGHEDPYTIWLYDGNFDGNIHSFIYPTLEMASKSLGGSLPGIILKKQKLQQLPDNSSLHDEEKI